MLSWEAITGAASVGTAIVAVLVFVEAPPNSPHGVADPLCSDVAGLQLRPADRQPGRAMAVAARRRGRGAGLRAERPLPLVHVPEHHLFGIHVREEWPASERLCHRVAPGQPQAGREHRSVRGPVAQVHGLRQRAGGPARSVEVRRQGAEFRVASNGSVRDSDPDGAGPTPNDGLRSVRVKTLARRRRTTIPGHSRGICAP